MTVVGITSNQAATIIDTTLAYGSEQELEPLAVVVLDAGGHLVAARRADGAGFMRIDVARAKAYARLAMGLSTPELMARTESPAFWGALTALADGRMIAFPGGVRILDEQGHIAGAVGVSGDVSDKDEQAAVAGVRAADGLNPLEEDLVASGS